LDGKVAVGKKYIYQFMGVVNKNSRFCELENYHESQKLLDEKEE